MGGCGGHERTDFYEFLFWEDVVVLKELIFTFSFYLWKGVAVLKELIFHSFYFGRCGGLERTDFSQFLLGKGST